MTFKPSLHGWGFDDSFTPGGPALGVGAAPASLRLGGGMCWAALDRFLDGRAIPAGDATPEPGSPLHAEILQRQVAALAGVWPRLREWQALPDGSWRDRLPVGLTPGRRDLASLTRATWPRLRRSIAAGRPVLLTLVDADDPYARALAARQVLAYDCARAGAVVTLSIYDPARPDDDEVRLAFSLNGPLDARATGGQRVRGFFDVPYDRDPAACLHAETFADRAVLGLGRKVRGSPRAAAGRRGLHLVARDGTGALIHFHRRYGRHWDGQNVAERKEVDAPELHSDPRALAGPAGIGLHVFARSYVGDLIHFRAGRRWRVSNRTDNRRAGPRFRLDGDPLPFELPWGAMCVIGRGLEGGLVAYSALPFRGWHAEEVPAPAGAVIDGDPVAATIGATLHVVARARNGRLLHFERTKGGWSAGDLVTLCEGASPVASAPVLIVHQHQLHVFGVTADGRLLHLRMSSDGEWSAGVALQGVTGEPTATIGPAGLHVFGLAGGGGLRHGWRNADRWRSEEVTATRASARPSSSPTSGLIAWGSGDELRVFGRCEGSLVQWLWRADSDWVAGTLAERAGVAPRHEPGEDPVLAAGRRGGFHLFSTDGSGAVVHVERGPWRAASTRGGGFEAGAVVPAERASKAKSAGGPKSQEAAEAPAAEEEALVVTLPKQVPVPESVKLPTPGVPAEGDEVDATDLPLLEPLEPAGPGSFDWGAAPDPDGTSPPVEIEPLDLDRLESWPPKAPVRKRKEEQKPVAPESAPPPWPEEG